MVITVACLQMNIEWDNEILNIEKAIKALDELGRKQINVICFPELFTTGFNYSYIKDRDNSINNEILNKLSEKARERGSYIIAGSLPEKDKDKIYNTLFVLDPTGKCVESYRKIHLFPLMDEDEFFSPGEKIVVFNTPWTRIGVAICYDLRFPDLFQSMALGGAEMIFVPAQFPSARIGHWDTLLKARAIENQVFMVGVNRIGNDPAGVFSGHTSIFHPIGDLVAAGGEHEGWIAGSIDLKEVNRVRRELPTLF